MNLQAATCHAIWRIVGRPPVLITNALQVLEQRVLDVVVNRREGAVVQVEQLVDGARP